MHIKALSHIIRKWIHLSVITRHTISMKQIIINQIFVVLQLILFPHASYLPILKMPKTAIYPFLMETDD